MAKITISYRREDSGIIVGRIFDRLVAHYGTDTVFRDIDNIPPGIDFREYINEALSSTDILLAVVGPDWAGKTPDGRTRIAEPTDFVRVEVEAALRKRIPVVPVLVAKATMPNPNELPEALQDFAYRNAVKVDAFEDFDDHLRRLIRSLDRLLQSAGVRPPRIEVQKGAEQGSDKAVGDVTALGAKQDELQEAGSMFNLGKRYELAQDYGKAREWYEKEAAKDNAYAMYNLGRLYENGRGVARDSSKAREWYEKAAAKGHAYAKARLGHP